MSIDMNLRTTPGLPPATAQQLCAWLNTLDGTRHDATPVWVRIGNTIYPSGGRYTDNVGETVIYLLGSLPRSYADRALYAITSVEADPMLWYVSGYFPARPEDGDNPQFTQYHPFGRMFMLRRSDVPVKRDRRGDANFGYWLTHGGRGGLRPIQNIKVIPLGPDESEAEETARRLASYGPGTNDVIAREILS